MDNLQFIQRLYNGKYCYSDSMSKDQISLLHIPSGVESIIRQMIDQRKIIFLTGNPGDGKTFIIKALKEELKDVYVEPDMNRLKSSDVDILIDEVLSCYEENKPCVIAANEFPFHKLTVRFRSKSERFYKELMEIKRNVLIYGNQTIEMKRICIIDLNERNLLDKDRCVVKTVLERFTELLQPYCGSNKVLAHNVKALENALVQQQILNVFSYIAMSGKHFVIRDILGTLSYMLVRCTDPDIEEKGYYYDALFDGGNELMSYAQQFDPVLLSSPTWDERLWNGEINEGWQLDCPQEWPIDISNGSGTVEEAVLLFKSIKRKFFFENYFAKELVKLQPQDFSKCMEILVRIRQDERSIRRRLIKSMNKLFLSTDEENQRLRAWTVHSYDLSRTAGAAVSTRYISEEELELVAPVPAAWLVEMEYVPSYIIMRSCKRPDVRLEIDMDFLRSLILVENGYPTSLLSSQYEQMVTQFVQALCAAKLSKDYYDGEIIIANRHEGTCKNIRINHSRYYIEKEGEY